MRTWLPRIGPIPPQCVGAGVVLFLLDCAHLVVEAEDRGDGRDAAMWREFMAIVLH